LRGESTDYRNTGLVITPLMKKSYAEYMEWVNRGQTGNAEYTRPASVEHSITVNFSSRAACLDAFHPRFVVQTHPDLSEDYVHANWLAAFLIALGIVLPIQSAIAKRARAYAPPRMLPELALRNVTRWPWGRRPMQFLSSPSAAIGVFAIVEMALMFTMMALEMQTDAKYGLMVDLAPGQIARAPESPWHQTMSVRVTARGEYVVNGKVVAPQELRAALEAEFSRRPAWMVYVEGDDNVEFAAVLRAMDVIQGLGAQVLWITPEVRRKWDAGGAHSAAVATEVKR
jgi:biopolymer transport protein ExbD